jgi:hypothetical protein
VVSEIQLSIPARLGRKFVKETIMKEKAHYLRKLIACVVCLNVGMLTPWVGIANASSPPTLLADKITKELVNSRAARYTQALNEINRLATMPLKSRDDLRRAHEVVKKNKEGLRFVRYRMIQIATEHPVLRKSVEDEVKKNPTQEGLDAIFQRLKNNPSSVFEFNGARQAQRAIESQLKRDAEVLRSGGSKLKEAAAALEKEQRSSAPSPTGQGPLPASGVTKSHYFGVQNSAPTATDVNLHAGGLSFDFDNLTGEFANHSDAAHTLVPALPQVWETIVIVLLLIAVGLVLGAVGAAIGVYIGQKWAQAMEGTEANRALDDCIATADNSYIQCLAGCETALCPDCCRLGCDSIHLLALGACYLLPIGPTNVVDGP